MKIIINEDHLKKINESKEKDEFISGLVKIELIVDDSEGELQKLLKHLEWTGNAGHSHSIIIDPDASKEDGQQKIFWDGDGADRIKSIKVTKIDE